MWVWMHVSSFKSGMGAGKGHTLKQLLKDGHLRLPSDFVWVDPDSLARSLPEREQYIRADPKTASKKLHPEAALLQEILSGVAKLERRPLVIDGSLSDCAWFGRLMKSYREDGYACEILFVVSHWVRKSGTIRGNSIAHPLSKSYSLHSRRPHQKQR